MCIRLFDHSTINYWPLYKDPKHLRLSSMYEDIDLAPLLRKCVAVDPADRCEFSHDFDSGMLSTGSMSSVAGLKMQLSLLVPKGQVPDRSYWDTLN